MGGFCGKEDLVGSHVTLALTDGGGLERYNATCLFYSDIPRNDTLFLAM